MEGAQNSKTSGDTDFDDTKKEAEQGRLTGYNESGNRNRPTRDRDGVEPNSNKPKD